MKTKEAFPRTTAHLNQSNPKLAEAFGCIDLDWNHDESTERLRNALIMVQQLCKGDLDPLTAVTTQILLDILALRTTATPAVELVLNFIQIDISITVMGTACGQKRLQLMFDWTIYSLSDKYPFALENQFEISRLFDLFGRSRPSLYASLGRENGLEWIRLFYYYAFKVGGNRELASLLAPAVTELLRNLLPASDAIEPAVRVAEWSVRNAYADRIGLLADLKQVFDRSEPGSNDHLLLGLAFALLLGRDQGLDTNVLARGLLHVYERKLPPTWELQLRQAALIPNSTEILQNLDALVDNIRRYREETLSSSADVILVEYEFARSFTLVNAMVLSLLLVGESNAAATLIAAWKGQFDGAVRNDVLFILPNEASGVLYARQGMVFRTDAVNRGETYSHLIDAINHFHGVNIVLDDDDTLVPHIANRPGLPEDPVQASRSYLDAILEQFRLVEANEFLLEAKHGFIGALQMVLGLPCPLQPVMIKEIGFSWPIASTMSSPHSDRACRRALIWAGSTFWGLQQADWIAQILRPQIQVTIASGDAEAFRAEFSCPEYDAIWVTTHGEFDHMDPHRSTLLIDEGTEVTFDDLNKIPVPNDGRRLLVLDACDSGAEPVYGGPSSLGFGPLLASSDQAVICYRWPVEQFASVVFNALLALGLRTRSFYGAYEFAVNTIIHGKQQTIEELAVVLGQEHDLVRRIRDNESLRWNILAFWGSAAFLE